MKRSIGITFQSDGGHVSYRRSGKPAFQIVIFRITCSQAEPPTIIMDHDAHMIRVVERRRAAIERRIVEVPLRRSKVPDELRKVVPVFVVPGSTSFPGKIILIPPLQLSLWRQRHCAGFLAADQITAYRDERFAALGPEGRDDVGSPRSPVEAPRIAFSIWRASIRAMISSATTDCWPFRNVLLERKRVVPYPRRYGTTTR
jgi:hypothetical protein